MSARGPVSFGDHLGVRLVGREARGIIVEMDIETYHLNKAGSLHGGAILCLIDIACAVAAGSSETGEHAPVATLSLTTSFTGVAAQGRVTAVARRRAGGQNIAFASVDVFDDQDKLVAMGEATYAFRRPRTPRP